MCKFQRCADLLAPATEHRNPGRGHRSYASAPRSTTSTRVTLFPVYSLIVRYMIYASRLPVKPEVDRTVGKRAAHELPVRIRSVVIGAGVGAGIAYQAPLHGSRDSVSVSAFAYGDERSRPALGWFIVPGCALRRRRLCAYNY